MKVRGYGEESGWKVPRESKDDSDPLLCVVLKGPNDSDILALCCNHRYCLCMLLGGEGEDRVGKYL